MNDGYGVWEIYPGLILGSLWNYRELMGLKPNVLVVLDRLPESVWDDGFSGEILYYPIRPHGVLPARILDRMTTEIVDRLQAGKRVAVFSREDRGRLGYAVAWALFRLGVRKPADYLRKNHSDHALDDDVQRAQIEELCPLQADGTRRPCVQRIEHIQIDDIEAFEHDEDIMRELKRIGDALGEEARILVRFSGLLPSVYVMVEAANETICENSIHAFVEVMMKKGHFVDYITD